jgi:hypothetical protein
MEKYFAGSGEDGKNTKLHDYHLRQIGQGLTQAHAGQLIDYEDLKAAWKKRLANSTAASLKWGFSDCVSRVRE